MRDYYCCTIKIEQYLAADAPVPAAADDRTPSPSDMQCRAKLLPLLPSPTATAGTRDSNVEDRLCLLLITPSAPGAAGVRHTTNDGHDVAAATVVLS